MIPSSSHLWLIDEGLEGLLGPQVALVQRKPLEDPPQGNGSPYALLELIIAGSHLARDSLLEGRAEEGKLHLAWFEYGKGAAMKGKGCAKAGRLSSLTLTCS